LIGTYEITESGGNFTISIETAFGNELPDCMGVNEDDTGTEFDAGEEPLILFPTPSVMKWTIGEGEIKLTWAIF
jgi:hypothetical protein